MKFTPLKVALFFIITFSVLTIFGSFLAYKNILLGLGAWNNKNNMSVFIKSDADETQINTLVEKIKSQPDVNNVSRMSRNEAAQDFQVTLKEYANGLVTSDELLDLVPITLDIGLSDKLNLEQRLHSFDSLAAVLRTESIIDELSYSASWLRKFEAFDRGLRAFGLFVFLALLLLISYAISLMLRVYIDESKSEIEVYSLLGATRWSIYKLYLQQLMLFISLSLAVSTLLSWVGFKYIKQLLEQAGLSAAIINHLDYLNWGELLFLIGTFSFIVLLHAFLTVSMSVGRLNQISND